MKKLFFVTIIAIVCMFTVIQLTAFMAGNESESAFVEPGTAGLNSINPVSDVGKENISAPTLGGLIAEGGGYFLKAGSEIQLFSSRIEFSEVNGLDFKTLQESLDAAVADLEKAGAAYDQLKNLAAVTPYNQEVIARLIEFDYDKFQEKNNLIPVVFERVRKYLITGDVRGVYNEFYSHTGQILELLYTLKKDVDAGIFPNLSILWRLNQNYSQAQLFGQYVAEVFYCLK
jgi:hypothetical protein